MGDVVGGRGGTVVAVFQMSGDLGAVLGPVVAGWIADSCGLCGDVPGERGRFAWPRCHCVAAAPGDARTDGAGRATEPRRRPTTRVS